MGVVLKLHSSMDLEDLGLMFTSKIVVKDYYVV